MMGKEQPDDGTIDIESETEIIGVVQEQMEELNPERNFFAEIVDVQVDQIELGSSTQVPSCAHASWFSFKSNQQQAIVGNLSGDE